MAQASVIETAGAAKSRSRMSVTAIRFSTIATLFVLWEVLATIGRFGLLYKDVVPSTVHIVAAVFGEILDPTFYVDLGITLAEHVVGFTVGSLIAISTGIALGAIPFLRRAVEPYINGIGSTPKIVFLPILFLVFGTGIESKMAKGALSAFFPVVFSTTLGMVLINPVLLLVGKSFNLSRWQMVFKIYVPAMVNPVITGLRLGMAITVIGILVAEIKFSNGGMGYRISEYYDQFRIAEMYAMIIGVAPVSWTVMDLGERGVAGSFRS